MQAKPGRLKQVTAVAGGKLQLDEPANLTPDQKKVWIELCNNPFLSYADESLMRDYMEMLSMKDAASQALREQGTHIDDAKGSEKTHPAYKIFRDCHDRISKLRDQLLMTPKSRLQVQASNIPSVDDDEDEMAALIGG